MKKFIKKLTTTQFTWIDMFIYGLVVMFSADILDRIFG